MGTTHRRPCTRGSGTTEPPRTLKPLKGRNAFGGFSLALPPSAALADETSGLNTVVFPTTVSPGGTYLQDSAHQATQHHAYSFDSRDSFSAEATVAATDRATNESQATFRVTRDATPPTLNLDATVQGSDLHITWSAWDPWTGSGLDTSTCRLEVREDDGGWEPLPVGCSGTHTHDAEAGHAYTFRLTASDNVSNTASVEAQASIPHVKKYYYANGQRVAMRQGDVVYYVHSDHLGSTSVLSDGSGQPAGDRVAYLPYGGVRLGDASTLPTDYTFTGQRLEAGLGLMHYGARFYSPRLGRFVSADTIVPQPGDPQALNRYSYVRNNPVIYRDPSGHAECIDAECRRVVHPVTGEIIQLRSAPLPEPDLTALWDPYYSDCVNARDRQAAEQAFLHFLDDPLYFATLYTDPEAWRTSDEVAALDVFMMYSVFHITAEDLVSVGFNPHVADSLSLAHFHHGLADESGTDYFLALAGVAIPELIGAAEKDYPKKAGRWEWHHYTPKYLGGDPSGTQYRIPAPYHQYITNEFRQLWRYKNPAGRPDPVQLQEIMR